MNDPNLLVETDPLECFPNSFAQRIAEIERLVHELGAPHAHELETLRRELERRLHEGRRPA